MSRCTRGRRRGGRRRRVRTGRQRFRSGTCCWGGGGGSGRAEKRRGRSCCFAWVRVHSEHGALRNEGRTAEEPRQTQWRGGPPGDTLGNNHLQHKQNWKEKVSSICLIESLLDSLGFFIFSSHRSQSGTWAVPSSLMLLAISDPKDRVASPKKTRRMRPGERWMEMQVFSLLGQQFQSPLCGKVDCGLFKPHWESLFMSPFQAAAVAIIYCDSRSTTAIYEW